MLIPCPECTNNVSEKALACPYCGFPIQTIVLPSKEEKPVKKANTKPRKKYKKLPNGFGTIQRLTGNRRRPYAAYPKTTEFNLSGSPVRNKAIGYYENWHDAYNALSDYNKLTDKQQEDFEISQEKKTYTFSKVYELYFNYKFKKEMEPGVKKSSMYYSMQSAFKNSSVLHDKLFRSIYTEEMQNVIDNCPLKHSSKELLETLFKQMSGYAMSNNIIDKDYSKYIKISDPDDDESGVPFSEDELKVLWEHKNDEVVQMILIMCYTGYRIAAFNDMEINTDEWYFYGGVKTKKNGQYEKRIVPIHQSLKPYICDNTYLNNFKDSTFRSKFFYPKLIELGLEISSENTKHTPHDCRHTFSWLCDKAKIDDLTKHMLMGHKPKGDIEKSVYGHRTVDELRKEIKKLKTY